MYPELYQKWFQFNLNPTELVLIEILMKIVGLLSKATLGHKAANLPLPILAASRLKTLQRFLDSPRCLVAPSWTGFPSEVRRFCKEKIWWGIWMEIMTSYWLKQEPIVLAITSRLFLQGVNISTTAHKFTFNVAIHYPKEHHGMPIEEGWFILTTLPNLTTIMFGV